MSSQDIWQTNPTISWKKKSSSWPRRFILHCLPELYLVLEIIWGKMQIWRYPFLSQTWAPQNLSTLQFPACSPEPLLKHKFYLKGSEQSSSKFHFKNFYDKFLNTWLALLPQDEAQSSNVRGIMAAGPAEQADLHQHLKVTFICTEAPDEQMAKIATDFQLSSTWTWVKQP